MRKINLVIIIGMMIVLLSLTSAVTWKSDGVQTMKLDDFGNLSVVGNITTTNYGFFGWLGSLSSRITKLFVQNIDVSGTLNLSGDLIVNNSDLFVNVSSGNVGIGELSPYFHLTVVETSGVNGATLGLKRTDTLVSSGNRIGRIAMMGGEANSDTVVGTIIVDADANWNSTSSPTRMEFHTTNVDSTGNTERMRIDSSGNVGIGTISPDSTITFFGTTATKSRVRIRRASDSAFGSALSLTHVRGTEASPTSLLSGDELGKIRGRGYAGSEEINGVEINFKTTENWTASATGAEINFATIPNGAIIRQTRMTIGNDGKVGIGTTTPLSTLDVYGGNITLSNSTATENNYFKFGRGGYMYDNGTHTIIGHS